ncbi:ABC transporter [Methylopila jiangsuensis]|uniref:ABC transporter n=1 Tax=Methylopila jiangsuensis TaxID=586230 RepID=A0A9W6JGV3_9HYPH|nr:ABC transporter ATP-binding protein [Methylopila jiangsuensis]MDR6285757.1 iron complex transport system ATP-binding protein [Methylopila jiangsuensis]GLK75514.1 ABC transporter [Methylopila jiangsuensis]
MEIVALNLTVRLGGAPRVDRVSLTLRPGELVGLIGPNGAGKTTLFRALAGLRAPDEGQVLYDGRRLAHIGRRTFAKRLAYLEQTAEAHWPLRAEHVVALGRLPHRGFGRAALQSDAAAVDRALRAADAEGFRGRPMRELSGGERARVLLARAFAVESEWLLADEPAAALDPAHQLGLMERLAAAARRGMGVVVVLHDLTLATRFCDRLILMAGGRILGDGRPGEVLTDAAAAAAYGVTLARAQVERETLVAPWRRLASHDSGRMPL